ncbi:MAG: ribbon-helix-helix protein, CopG family [bacterium]|nr:ribbon-helix-helix protein, CopG family [bacterium]
MKAISVHVAEDDYQGFKVLANLRGRPIAELLREAMAAYLKRESPSGRSLRQISAHESGRMLCGWTREEIFDEMLER